MPNYTYLIVGGGMTADAAVHGIREVDRNGSIGLLGAEKHALYDHPPLAFPEAGVAGRVFSPDLTTFLGAALVYQGHLGGSRASR